MSITDLFCPRRKHQRISAQFIILYCRPSSLHGPYHDTFHKETLQERIQNNDRECARNNYSTLDGNCYGRLIPCPCGITYHTGSIYDISQEKHDRELSTLEVNQSIEPIIPEKYGGIESNGGQGSSGKRKDYSLEHPEIIEPVNNGSFFEIQWNGLEKIDHENQIELIDGKRKQHGPSGIDKMQGRDKQIIRDETTGEEHGEYNQFHDDRISSKSGFTEWIGKEDHHDQGNGSSRYGIENCIPIGVKEIWIRENLAIGFKGQSLGNQENFIIHDCLRAGERKGNHIHKGNKTSKQSEYHHKVYQ